MRMCKAFVINTQKKGSTNIIIWIKRNWQNPWLVTIVGGLILLFIWAVIAQPWEEFTNPPRIEIDQITFSPNTFNCGIYSDMQINYKIFQVGGKDTGRGQPYYLFVNQTKNSCMGNFTFFNKTPIAMCNSPHFDIHGELLEGCSPKFDPLTKEPRRIKSRLSTEVRNMLDTFKNANVSDCNISENIKICAAIDEKPYCSGIQEININYIACKS